jgi:hypothetical protein
MIKPNGYCGSYAGKMDCAEPNSQGPEAGGGDFCAGSRRMNMTTTGLPWWKNERFEARFLPNPLCLLPPKKASLLYDGLCKFTRLL